MPWFTGSIQRRDPNKNGNDGKSKKEKVLKKIQNTKKRKNNHLKCKESKKKYSSKVSKMSHN